MTPYIETVRGVGYVVRDMNKLRHKIMNLSLKMKWTFAVGVTIFISYAVISIILYFALQTWLLNNEEKNALRTVDDLTTFFACTRKHCYNTGNSEIIRL